MKLLKILRRSKTQFLAKLPSNDIFSKSLASFCLLALIAIVIWFLGPYLQWHNQFPLVVSEKRAYIIICLFLLWLLKLLLIDLDAPNPLKYKDLPTRQKLQALQTRFFGALTFLKKTTITRNEKLIALNQLPWFLLLGPANAGKTTLLANANINFILQKQFQHQDLENLTASETCDWWATRDACIVDVPSKYLYAQEIIKKGAQKIPLSAVIWRFFLSLVKRHRGKNGLRGIIITMPFPEIMKQDDAKKYQALLRDLFHRISEIHSYFPQKLPCYLIVTKCDLLAGFSEFFAESGNEEIGQAWGITLANVQSGQKASDYFVLHFNALIKKLNQQLLWRLHQERNPMARPHIKDFPLQIERLKECTNDFIKRFSAANLAVSLQGVYLTSALQQHSDAEQNTAILEDVANNAHRAIQIFKEPTPVSRAYFIKQFILQGLNSTGIDIAPPKPGNIWKVRLAIAASLAAICGTAVLLGKDFEQGVNQAYSIQNYISEYQLAIQKNEDPEDHLVQAIILLDTLQSVAKNTEFKLDLPSLLSFYSNKAQLKANVVYQHALKTIFISGIKNFLEEYLRNPVNKNTEYVYAVLKAYLMLGDTHYFQPDFVLTTVQVILPRSFNAKKAQHLIGHLELALNSWEPISLNTNLIQQTRNYFTAMPSFQLGYIILKTLNNNSTENTIDLGTNHKNSVFIGRQVTNKIPTMFSARAFPNIIAQETIVAAQEAIAGNWVLGSDLGTNKAPEMAATLIEQLRIAYVNNYIDVWENLVSNIQLAVPKDIYQLDNMLVTLTNSDSPLLQLLHTLHDNTYFEPIASSSQKLQSLGILLDKNPESENQLYQIFASIQSLHIYLQAILTATDEKKAAFEAVSKRMLTQEKPDALTQLRIVAGNSPEPIRTWLDKIANHAWHFLMKDAANYIDTSWQHYVSPMYQTEIANRYPFSPDVKKDVELKKFSKFFGKPGIIVNFYMHFLMAFIDNSTAEWHWKVIENEKLPFPEILLKQMQQALLIHRTFFPNGDDKLYVQFALQPYKFDKQIKSVKFNINDKQILDLGKGAHNPHVFAWPTGTQLKKTSIQLLLANQKMINREYPGDWGWFKLVSQSFESAVTKKELLINLAMSDQPVRYLLSTEGQVNPFLSLGLRHFNLPERLIDSKN